MNGPSRLRTALVHHWLVTMRGGEKVLEALMEIYPNADLFTLVCDRRSLPPPFHRARIRTSFLQRLPRPARWYPYYLPLFPAATERLDLSGYDLIISSDAATMKGVRAAPGATHICYCHTPMRYVWSGFEVYRNSLGPLGRWFFPPLAERLRRWDFDAAQRVTHFVANSANVAERIGRYYMRDSAIIYPPVDTDYFLPAQDPAHRSEEFLMLSQLVRYKRADLVVEAFNRSGRPLIVIGEGPEGRRLRRLARPNVRFLGAQSDGVVRHYLQRSRALIFAGEEDFGIVMAEATACGTPVIAYGSGGACEIVEDGRSGILFEEQTVEAILGALVRFERTAFDPLEIRRSAERFGRQRFQREVSELVKRATTRARTHSQPSTAVISAGGTHVLGC